MEKNFKTIFIDLMKERNVIPVKISKETGISSGLISDYRSGRSVPATENLIKIADFFNVTTDYLLGRTIDNVKYVNNGTRDSKIFQGLYNSPVTLNGAIEQSGEEKKENNRLNSDEDVILEKLNTLDLKRKIKVLNLLFTLHEEMTHSTQMAHNNQ